MDKNLDKTESHRFAGLQRNIWFILAGVIGIVAAISGFIGYYSKGYGILNSAYNTWSLFILNFAWKGYPDNPVPAMVELARWFAPVSTFISVAKALQMAFQKQWRRAVFSWQGDHTIICGADNGAIVLAEELLNKGEKVALVVEEQAAMNLNELEERGLYKVIGNMLDTDTLKKACIDKCKRIVLMEQDDVANIGVAIKFSSLCCQKGKADKTELYIHLMDKSISAVFTSSQAYYENSHRIDLHIFNNYENLAKMLFRSYQFYSGIDIFAEEARKPHLLIIGFGNAGEQVLLQAIMNGHLPNDTRVKTTILDRNARAKEEYFIGRYPQIYKHCKEIQRNFKEMDVETNSFSNYIKNNLHDITQIVICFDDDKRSLSTALLILEHAKKEIKERDIRIAVRIGKTVNIVSAVDNNNDVLQQVFCFGWMQQIATEDVVINESLDRMAKAAHENYKSQNPAEERGWNELTLFEKESNRAQVEHIGMKLHVLGLFAVAPGELKSDYGSEIKKQELEILLDDKKELLARMEHERWNAFHYVNGWDTLTTEDLRKKYDGRLPLDDKERVHKDEDYKKHVCIVNWDELDKVGKDLEKMYKSRKFNFKQYDVEHVKEIPNILRKTGYKIYRKNQG